THLLNRAKLLKERDAVAFAVLRRLRLAVDHQAKLAVGEVHTATARLRHPITVNARRRGTHDRVTAWAFPKCWRGASFASGVGRILCALVGLKRPFDVILGQAMPKDGARVVKNDGVGLSVRRPQNATDHLPVKPHLPGRSGENAATDFGHIP